MSNGDPNIFCRHCGVTDDRPVKCDMCDAVVPHDELVHYDGEGVVCQDCDKFIENPDPEDEECM